jgi:hypothetical protein
MPRHRRLARSNPFFPSSLLEQLGFEEQRTATCAIPFSRPLHFISWKSEGFARLTCVNREDMMLICMVRHRHLASRYGSSTTLFGLGFTGVLGAGEILYRWAGEPSRDDIPRLLASIRLEKFGKGKRRGRAAVMAMHAFREEGRASVVRKAARRETPGSQACRPSLLLRGRRASPRQTGITRDRGAESTVASPTESKGRPYNANKITSP